MLYLIPVFPNNKNCATANVVEFYHEHYCFGNGGILKNGQRIIPTIPRPTIPTIFPQFFPKSNLRLI